MSKEALGRPGIQSVLTFTNIAAEQSFELPFAARGFEMFARSAANIRWSYTEGQTLVSPGGVYRTIPQGEAGGTTGVFVQPQPTNNPGGTTDPVMVYVSVSAPTEVEVEVYPGN